MKKWALVIFIVSAIVFIVANYLGNNLISGISKPIPVLVLIVYMRWDTHFNKMIGFGLIFSLAGDVLLELKELFIPGLIAFLIAHVFYILSFVKRNKSFSILKCLPFFAYAIVIYLFLFSHLGEMGIPVAIYVLVITIMLWRSLAQFEHGISGKLAFWGALSFGFSDSVLAINRFYYEFELSTLLVMLTYWTAQYLIFRSTKTTEKTLM